MPPPSRPVRPFPLPRFPRLHPSSPFHPHPFPRPSFLTPSLFPHLLEHECPLSRVSGVRTNPTSAQVPLNIVQLNCSLFKNGVAGLHK